MEIVYRKSENYVKKVESAEFYFKIALTAAEKQICSSWKILHNYPLNVALTGFEIISESG